MILFGALAVKPDGKRLLLFYQRENLNTFFRDMYLIGNLIYASREQSHCMDSTPVYLVLKVEMTEYQLHYIKTRIIDQPKEMSK